MARLHLFEFEDFPWFPAVVRDAGTAYLRFMEERSGQARQLAAKVGEVLRAAGETRVVDLCSGGAGPVPAIVEELAKEGLEVRATLTDFFPNEPALDRASRESAGRVTFERTPVDATHVPPHLAGLRTIFNAFHHFEPDRARRILEDAVRARQPIAIFEGVRRSPAAIAGMLLLPPVVLASVPFLRPFRWSWLPLTYVVPVIPAFITWDGVVSCFRVYSEDELRKMTLDIPAKDWTWEIGSLPVKGVPVPATYLVGRPQPAAR